MRSPLDGFAPPSHSLLGPRPDVPASRQWDELAALVDRAPEVIRTANRLDPRPSGTLVDDPALWHAAVESAERVLTIARSERVVARGFGIER